MLTEEQLREIEAGLKAPSPGRWEWGHSVFIARARTWIPQLLAMVRELQRQRAILAASIEASVAFREHKCKKHPKWCPSDDVGCDEAHELLSKDEEAFTAAWELLHPETKNADPNRPRAD